MASTYVNNLRLNEMATGDGSGTWGTTTNTNLELIGQAFGYGTRAIANASTDNITIADGASDADRSMYLKLTGGGQACTVTLLPNTASKVWIMENVTSYTLAFTCGSGANVSILAGETKMIATDGLGSGGVVYDVLTDVNLVGTTKTAALTNAGALSNQGTVTVGVDDTGYDVKLFGATSGAYMLWDESADDLKLVGAAGLTVAGDIDIDGTTNLDAVDIDGNVQLDGTLTVGVDDTGKDVNFFGATSGQKVFWDESADTLYQTCTVDIDGTVTVGVDDTGYDVKFFGATASAYMLWDESADDLILAGAARVVVPASGLVIASTAVTTTAAELNLLDAITRGSIIYGNASGASARLAVGSNGQALTTDGTDISWGSAGATSINGLSDCKTFGTSSLMLGDATTGTIDAANYNTGLGVDIFAALTSGDGNVAIGFAALAANTTGTGNIAIGRDAGQEISTGSYSTVIGWDAANGMTTGPSNVIVGAQTADGMTEIEKCIIIGRLATAAATNNDSMIAIGYNTTGKGDSTGFINAGGGANYAGNNSASWSTTSDRRIKKNIEDNTIGLDEINKIRVRNFEYRTVDEIVDFDNANAAVVEKEGIQLGVIAQEIEEVLPDVVSTTSQGVKSVDPDNITWHLVNAVQELTAQVETLKQEVETLKGE